MHCQGDINCLLRFISTDTCITRMTEQTRVELSNQCKSYIDADSYIHKWALFTIKRIPRVKLLRIIYSSRICLNKIIHLIYHLEFGNNNLWPFPDTQIVVLTLLGAIIRRRPLWICSCLRNFIGSLARFYTLYRNYSSCFWRFHVCWIPLLSFKLFLKR